MIRKIRKFGTVIFSIISCGSIEACTTLPLPMELGTYPVETVESVGIINLVDFNYLQVALNDFVASNSNPQDFSATVIGTATTVRVGFSIIEVERDHTNSDVMIVHTGSGKAGDNVEYEFQRGNLRFRKFTPR